MLKKFNSWLHLWLGLISGIVVFIVSITGCIYVFHQEIEDALEPWRFVKVQDKGFAPPSRLIDTAKVYVPGKNPTGLTYGNKKGAAAVGFSSVEDGKRSFSVVFLNPYSGRFIKKEETLGRGNFDFFRFIMDGHRALWLPYKIGRRVVGVCTLIFLVLLITGLVMWWPQKWNKKNVRASFKIKWKAVFKRLNRDLHNVLGFYSLIFALMIAVTGLVWSFQWFGDSLYFVTSGGQKKPSSMQMRPHSDTSNAGTLKNDSVPVLDQAWYKTIAQESCPQRMFMAPEVRGEDGVIAITTYKLDGRFYNRNTYYYDQYTLEPIRVKGDRFSEAGFADQVSMLNYDIHTGAALGLVGKIIAFFVSFICASLPVTGFIIWWQKKKKKFRKGLELL